jgi:hypothetical protein
VSVDAPAPVPHNPAKKLVRPSSPIPRLTTPGGGALDATSKDVAWYVPTCNASFSNHHNEYDIMVLWFFQPSWNFPLHFILQSKWFTNISDVSHFVYPMSYILGLSRGPTYRVHWCNNWCYDHDYCCLPVESRVTPLKWMWEPEPSCRG